MKAAELLQYADIPSYVADKLKGADSMGEVAGFSIVDAKNSKVKAICSQLSELTNQKAKLEISIKASETKIELSTPLIVDINTNIKAKSDEISGYEDQYKSKNNEIAAKNTECSSAETKVQGIDAQLAYIDIRLAAEEASASKPNAAANQAGQNATVKSSLFGQYTNNATESAAGSSIDDELAKINQEYEEMLNSDVVNSDIAELKSKMEESDKVVLTLRNKLTDNAQKIINERLEATKRV